MFFLHLHHRARANSGLPGSGIQAPRHCKPYRNDNVSHFLFLLFSCQVMYNSFATPWTIACKAPLSIGFSSKNIGVGCHFLHQPKWCYIVLCFHFEETLLKIHVRASFASVSIKSLMKVLILYCHKILILFYTFIYVLYILCKIWKTQWTVNRPMVCQEILKISFLKGGEEGSSDTYCMPIVMV